MGYVFGILVGVLSISLLADSISLNLFKNVQDNLCPPDFSGLIPNPEDCKSFYICDHGFPALMKCPANLCFSPSGACDQCEFVPGCEGSAGSTTTTSAPTTSSVAPPTTSTTTEKQTTTVKTTTPEVTTTVKTTTPEVTTTVKTTTQSGGGDLTCPPGIEYIYMRYPGDCNKFYYCQDGNNTGTYGCGPGLWFHFQQQACVKPWSTECDA